MTEKAEVRRKPVCTMSLCGYLSVIILVLAASLTFSALEALGASVSFSWKAPTTYTDGSPVTDPLKFKLHYGSSSRHYTKTIALGTATTYTVKGLTTGTYYFALTAHDADGVTSGYSNEIVKNVDATPPKVVSFSVPATSSSLTVPVSSLTVTDNLGVTGYMITGKSTPPASDAEGWLSAPPATVTFFSAGTKILYAWAKDSSGNISNSKSATVTITLPSPAPYDVSFGAFMDGIWRIDANGDGIWDPAFDIKCLFGQAGDTPVVGDWTGDGTIKIGVFRLNTLGIGKWLLDMDGDCKWNADNDVKFTFGKTGDKPVVGDWTGDGTTKIGVFRKGTWLLDADGDGAYNEAADISFTFGTTGDKPVVGDWSGNGIDKIGTFNAGLWRLDFDGNGIWNSGTDHEYTFGGPLDKPVTGDWDNSGVTRIGIYRNGKWTIDSDGNGILDEAVDATITFGGTGFNPISTP